MRKTYRMVLAGAFLASLQMVTANATVRSDEQITADVSAVLSHDSKLVSRDPIAVSTRHGQVILAGKVETVPMIYRAVELTRKVDGVTKVDDEALTTYPSR